MIVNDTTWKSRLQSLFANPLSFYLVNVINKTVWHIIQKINKWNSPVKVVIVLYESVIVSLLWMGMGHYGAARPSKCCPCFKMHRLWTLIYERTYHRHYVAIIAIGGSELKRVIDVFKWSNDYQITRFNDFMYHLTQTKEIKMNHSRH